MSKLTDKEARELWVLLHLREALGDPTGKLMQDELVERARNAWADAQRYRWLREREVEISRYATVGRHASERLDDQIDAAIAAAVDGAA